LKHAGVLHATIFVQAAKIAGAPFAMKDLVPWTVVEIRLQTALVAKALDPGNLGERSLKFRSAVATFHTTELTPGRRLPVLEA